MYRFWRFGLKLPIHAPFGGVFLVIFPHITSDVIYRRDPQKDRAWAENVVWAIQRKNRCNGSTWARDRDNKKSQKCYISPIWREATTGPIRP